MSLGRVLKEAASEAGFLAAGWTRTSSFAGEAEKAEKADKEGLYPPFAPDPERAREPGRFLDGARSLLVVALAYPAKPDPPPGPSRGWVARFARGADYHDKVKRGLERLARVLERERPGVRFRAFVDTGPIWDKPAAVRAGLGFRGRNTLVLVPGAGSWVHLGGLVLDQDLGEAGPLVDGCGACRACIDACPTGALAWPGRLDYRRCLSFLTQKTGTLPLDYRTYLGPRLYGCDDCQAACPRSAWTDPTPAGETDENAFPRLYELLRLSRAGFRHRWENTALGWRGRGVIQRNAVIVAANSGDPSWTPYLLEKLSHPSPVVRGHAAWAVGCLGGAGVQRRLRQAQAREPNMEVKAEICRALRRFG